MIWILCETHTFIALLILLAKKNRLVIEFGISSLIQDKQICMLSRKWEFTVVFGCAVWSLANDVSENDEFNRIVTFEIKAHFI